MAKRDRDPRGDFLNQLSALRLHGGLALEFRFAKPRRWALDIAWPERLIGVEIHGGVWIKGRHTTGVGFSNDRRKMNTALELGWRVFEFTTEMVDNGEALETMKRVFGWRQANTYTRVQ